MSMRCAEMLALVLAATAPPMAVPGAALAQQVELSIVDVAKLGKGYLVSELLRVSVVNDKDERIGELQDFVLAGDKSDVFAVIQVGEFLDRASNLVAVPVRSLEISQEGRKVVLPGASKEALKTLPVFVPER